MALLSTSSLCTAATLLGHKQMCCAELPRQGQAAAAPRQLGGCGPRQRRVHGLEPGPVAAAAVLATELAAVQAWQRALLEVQEAAMAGRRTVAVMVAAAAVAAVAAVAVVAPRHAPSLRQHLLPVETRARVGRC